MNGLIDSIKKVGILPCLLLFIYFIDPVNLGYLFGYMLLLFSIFNKRIFKSLADVDMFILFLFSLVYALFYSFDAIKGSQFIFIYIIFPASFYLFGKFIAEQIADFKKLFYFVLALGIVFSLLGLISTLYNISDGGFVQVERDVSKIWGGNPISATGMAAYLFTNMCLPAILIFGPRGRKKSFYIFTILVYVLSVVCVLRLGSRTQLGITLITLVLSIVYKMSSLSPIKNLGIVGFLFVLINVGFSYLSLDADSDLLASYATRMNSKEYGAATAGGRTERWEKSIVNLFEEPLGWQVEDFGYSHNLWLDAARIGGTIAFVLLVIFSTKALLKVRKLLKKEKVPPDFKNVSLLFAVAFFLQFFVEPTLDGSFHLFVFYCLFQGIITKSTEFKIID